MKSALSGPFPRAPSALLSCWAAPRWADVVFCCTEASFHADGPEDPHQPAPELSPEPRQFSEDKAQV